MEEYYRESYRDFGDLLKRNFDVAEKLLYSKGIRLNDTNEPETIKPWMSRELIVYPTEYDFGLYQLQDGLYKTYGFADNEYYSLLDPMDFVDMNTFGEHIARQLDNDGRHVYTGDCVVESPYGFK